MPSALFPRSFPVFPDPILRSGEALGVLVTKELLDIWESLLSASDLSELRGTQGVPATAVKKLDALVLKQSETFGWRLGLSQLVPLRFSEWDFQSDGPRLFNQYGKALAKSVRFFQKLELPPIDDPELYQLKQETVSELRRFLRNLRNAFPKERASPSSDEIIAYFQTSVSTEGDVFTHLKANISSWLQFFRADSLSVKSLLHARRATPAALFDSWFAWNKDEPNVPLFSARAASTGASRD